VLRISWEHIHQEIGRVCHNVDVVGCFSKHEDLQRGSKNNVIHMSQEWVSWNKNVHKLSEDDLHCHTND